MGAVLVLYFLFWAGVTATGNTVAAVLVGLGWIGLVGYALREI
jgi:hypothetical protein